ncbi:carboxypeptidase regulatory-like domain-containing protein [bacterium CPR1]|nr:carboxypeptidase regulatory-like domain-containing protein [bacterium CPR1]
MRFRLLALSLLMVLASAFFGCGASDTVTTTDTLESTLPSRRWVGRIRLTGPINGAQIRFLDASGNLLAETTSNAAGVFFATLALPSTFRITATFQGPKGTSETFSTVYESAPPARGWLEVNAVTTLIDHYRQRHPELSFDQVEERIRGYFGVPRSRSLRNGVYSLRLSNFNHSLFLRRAREFPGGLPAYVQETVSAIDGQGLLSPQSLGLSDDDDDSTFGPSLPGQFGLSDGGGDDDDDPFAGDNTGVFNLNSLDDPDEPLPPDPPAVANFNTLVDDDGDDDAGDDDDSLASDTFDENEYVLVENNLVSEEATAAETAVVDDAEEVSLSSMASGVASAVGSSTWPSRQSYRSSESARIPRSRNSSSRSRRTLRRSRTRSTIFTRLSWWAFSTPSTPLRQILSAPISLTSRACGALRS